MKVHFIRSGERRYGMRIERREGPVLVMDPAPGFDPDLPHDMVHFVVEAAMGLKTGVFGQLAAGGDAGSFHVEAGGGLPAKERQRAARKQVARGARLAKAQGREGQLSELAVLLFDVDWRRTHRPDSPAQRAALAEAERTCAALSPDERARIDAARPQIFDAFDRLSRRWRQLRPGEVLVLEWPHLHPIG
ncbi:hypothetical protein FHR22_001999 [Sphingopyxis panaciterrae]|uniref:hypothetical protein n=1 Tax=Sphingopyxis panaciterrae TaxID=363841 RepID=UPI00141FAA67|nr:hypothetical protein [Sphingopyxis panaciterrae]NIJ37315.1 hypothetical protein [Sphingopyxis panaciterrae]